MNTQTFSHTILKTDKGTFRAGDVLSHVFHQHPWSQAIILGFSARDEYGACYVKLARPYAYATCTGTASPGVVTGAETYTMNVTNLKFENVLTAAGSGEHPYLVTRGTDQTVLASEVLDFTTGA
jgi:hypothetical protein